MVYDSTLVTFTYDDASGTVKTIHLTHSGFISSIRYRQTGVFKNIDTNIVWIVTYSFFMSMCDVQRWTFAFVIFQIKTSKDSIGVAKRCSAVMSLPDHADLLTASLAAQRFHWVVPFHLG